MPPTANIVSGKTSVCVTPVAVQHAARAPSRASTSRRGEGAAAVERALGHRAARAGIGEQQDRALQEQRRAVDGDGPAATTWWSPASRTTATKRRDQAADGEHQLHGVPAGAAA